MSDAIPPLKLSALERISKLIGERYSGSQITDFFEKAGFPEYRHDGTTKWRFVCGALQTIQEDTDGPFSIVQIIQTFCDPEECFGEGELHRDIVTQVNEVLGFYGMVVREDDGIIVVTGKINKTLATAGPDDALFSARSFHPEIEKNARLLYQKGQYFHAVFECCKAFDKYIRTRSGLDKHGTELMSAALSIKGPLKLNSLQTETERSEQEGLMHLCMGLMRAVRNPISHEPQLDWPISREDALDMMSLISFLYRQTDKLHLNAT